jgi:hypothetical protein
MPPQSMQAFRLARPSTPFGVDMYVRGTMNDWGAVDAAKFEYQGAELYEAKIYLSAGTYAFKIAGAYWEGAFGAINWRDVRTIEIGQPFTLEPTTWDAKNTGGDVLFPSVLNGHYIFSIDASNVLAPVLTIRLAD